MPRRQARRRADHPIHGLSCSGARDWAQVIPGLASGYDVYA
jgi:hypothetical protein